MDLATTYTSDVAATRQAAPLPVPWWRNAVIYQVYVRSFADSNGDGIGDLVGVTSRLPHLRDLGIDAIWLTPFYLSPMVDGGYDITDHRDVDPAFGSLADAKRLIAAAHEQQIRVIVDVVPNHTSDQHPWFQAALRAGPGSQERARYIFRDGRGPNGDEPPTDWRSVFGGPAWTRHADEQWFLHLFAPQQPDLNWEHADIHAEFLSILRHWLDLGVDGFRVDVAHGLLKDSSFPDLGPDQKLTAAGPTYRNHPHWDRDDVHGVYREWRALLDSYPGDRMSVAEVWCDAPDRMALYVRPDELHQAFNFDYLAAAWSAAPLREVIDASIASTRAVGAPVSWVLSNHDAVRVVTRYGDGPAGLRRARAAALLMLALPGSAYIYQGEELGLAQVQDLPAALIQDPTWHRTQGVEPGRDGCRVPLPWTSNGPSLGFGAAAAWLPQPASWRELSVEAQTGTPESTLELYRSALLIRKGEPGLQAEAMAWLPSGPDVLAFERGPDFISVTNLGDEPILLPAHSEVLLASVTLDESGVLPGHASAWLRR